MSKAVASTKKPGFEVKLAIVIPTRNRASLAISAIQSALSQTGCEVRVLVSDNSSLDSDIAELEQFCRELGDPRLVYVRPEQIMPQPAHWDWALQQAMLRFDASHFTVHYDRKIIKPGYLRFAVDAARRYPDLLITFLTDSVSTEEGHSKLWQTSWTKGLYFVQTSRVLDLLAHGRALEMGQAWPILSNCLVPRRALDEIQANFGNICDSTAPDSCFACRFCATNDRYLHLDLPIGIGYASNRSTGLGYLRGDQKGDFGDFVSIWGDRSWLEAAPIPGLTLGYNILFHEYALARRVAGNDRMPPINMAGYLHQLAGALPLIADEQTRAQMRNILKEYGWQEGTVAPSANIVRKLLTRLRLFGATARLFRKTESTWQKVQLFLADHSGFKPASLNGAVFANDTQAIAYGLKYPRRASKQSVFLTTLEASGAH